MDDSAAIRKILQRMLGQAGLTIGKVIEAGDGVEALAALKGKTVNLIPSDINMPDMDGIQLLTELKSSIEFKHIPAIMITTEGGEADGSRPTRRQRLCAKAFHAGSDRGKIERVVLIRAAQERY